MTALKDIFGQESAIESLRRAFAADRLPHGLIFAGPWGVGKATTAAALGAWFLCEKPGKLDACGKCPSCLAMKGNSHPDYHIVTKELARVHDKSGTSKATQLSINVIRLELSAPASRKTVMGRGKFFVIEEAELMTPAAQNALLKTLEEPWGRTLIVLLTPRAGDLLATVRSRCQTVAFAPLSDEIIRRALQQRGIAAATAKAAAEICDGSLGAAIRWIEDGVLEPAEALSAAIDRIFQGKPAGDLPDLWKSAADSLAKKALERDELASKDSAMRDALGVYLSIAVRRLRSHLMDTTEPRNLDIACRAIDAVALAEKYLDANVNVSLVVEQLSMSLAASGK
jgi:DNA polymerase III subunit delta'